MMVKKTLIYFTNTAKQVSDAYMRLWIRTIQRQAIIEPNIALSSWQAGGLPSQTARDEDSWCFN